MEGNPLFSGYLICADCGSKLYPMRSRGKTFTNYLCCGYRKAIRACTSHYIREEKLTELVLAEIQSVVEDYKKNTKAFTKKMQKKFQSESALSSRQAEKKALRCNGEACRNRGLHSAFV